MSEDGLPASPAEVLALDPSGADRLLEELADRVPHRPPILEIPARPNGSAVVFGDTHGDWLSTLEVVEEFHRRGPACVLIGLGDYVDRPPSDLPMGSIANAFFLLSLEARYPDRVVLLQGNHETMRSIPASPHSLPIELERQWGPSSSRYDRLLELFERGSVAAVLAGSRAYLAHAGFPRGPLPPDWLRRAGPIDPHHLLEYVWSECDATRGRRGVIEPWTEADLARFLASSGLSTVWRGHDPDLSGRPLYHDRVLTLHTTRIYARYGGVLLAVLPLSGSLPNVRAAEIRHLATERRLPPR
jgi:calcineurin-like phosphoesterase family protein